MYFCTFFFVFLFGKPVADEAVADLTADNILGTEYEINAGFPMPKTTVMAGLQFAF